MNWPALAPRFGGGATNPATWRSTTQSPLIAALGRGTRRAKCFLSCHGNSSCLVRETQSVGEQDIT